jgi:hypothetical protein
VFFELLPHLVRAPSPHRLQNEFLALGPYFKVFDPTPSSRTRIEKFALGANTPAQRHIAIAYRSRCCIPCSAISAHQEELCIAGNVYRIALSYTWR